MTEPLREISYSTRPYMVTADPGAAVYVGDYMIFPHQFGLFRLNVRTGKMDQRTTVGYHQPIFPPSITGLYIPPGVDRNQSVTWVGATEKWVVANCTVPVDRGLAPAAFVFRNDADLTLAGIVYVAAGYYWDFQKPARIEGDLLYVGTDRGTRDVISLTGLKFFGHAEGVNARPPVGNVDGYTYTISQVGDPWASGTFQQYDFIARRSDVPVPVAPPVVQPPPSVVTPPPPPTTEPPVTTTPPGTPPPGTPPPYVPPPVSTPPVMGSDLRLMNGAFNVSCRYDARDRNLDAGPALARKFSEQSGVFTFFSPDNWEVVVKYAVGQFFVAALTDVAFVLTMKHLASGDVKTFANASGNLLCQTIPFA